MTQNLSAQNPVAVAPKPARRLPGFRQPIFKQDRDGTSIALVPLAGGQTFAKLLPEDWERLVRMDAHSGWRLNSTGNGYAYVRCGRARFHGRLETVARLIVDAAPGAIVRYADGDRLNLRRDNLYFASLGKRPVTGTAGTL